MNEFELEIQQNNLERIKSIGYNLLEKGMVDNLSYHLTSKNKPLEVSKSGKEIKEKLQLENQSILTRKNDLYAKMTSLYGQIGIKPIKEIDSYKASDWSGKVQIPLTYCYSQIYDEQSNQDVPQAQMMREYNRYARQYFDKCIEERKLNTISNAISDNTTYKLSIDIASKLGF